MWRTKTKIVRGLKRKESKARFRTREERVNEKERKR